MNILPLSVSSGSAGAACVSRPPSEVSHPPSASTRDRFETAPHPAGTFEIHQPYRLAAVGPGSGEAFAAVDLKAFTTPWPAARFETLLAKPNVSARAAVSSEGTLGYFVMEHGAERGGADYLSSIGVIPEAQGKKVGERLFLEAVKTSRESGAPACWLHVDVTNHGAMRLYEKYGFEVAGLLPNNYAEDGHDGYEMVLTELQSERVGSHLEGLESKLEAAVRASRALPREHCTVRPSER